MVWQKEEAPDPQLAKDCFWVLKGDFTFQEWLEKVEWLHDKYPLVGFDKVIAKVIRIRARAIKNREAFLELHPDHAPKVGNRKRKRV